MPRLYFGAGKRGLQTLIKILKFFDHMPNVLACM